VPVTYTSVTTIGKMKKKVFKIIFGLVIVSGLSLFYLARYTSVKAGSDKMLFYNPFEIDEIVFKNNYNKAIEYQKSGDSIKAKEFFKKSIDYRGTHNERTREKRFSCGNGYWEYKQDKLLKYSTCYENIGQIDSAMSCLEPALYNFEKYHYPTEKRFFELAIKKYGKQTILEELAVAIKTTKEINCFMCTDYYFEFKGIKIGLDRDDVELKSDKLLKRLTDNYKI
jgi:tetratricopeptide (TPR) repeat protein